MRQHEAITALGVLIDSKLLNSTALEGTQDPRERQALASFVQPDGTLPAIGAATETYISDEWTASPSALHSIEMSYRSPQLLNVASRGRYGTSPASGMEVMSDSGIAVLRTPPTHLVLNAARRNGSPHHDDLAVTWHERGTAILIDGGEYHGAPGEHEDEIAARKAWLASPAAHNTIEVEGAPLPDPYPSAITRWRSLGMHFVDAELSRGSIAHRRFIVMAPGSWLLIHDSVSDAEGKAGIYRQHFLAGPRLTSARSDGSLVLGDGGRPVVFATQLADAAELPPRRGIDEPAHAGWWAPTPDRVAPALSFGWEQPGPQASFACVFTFEAVRSHRAMGETLEWTTKSGRIAVTLAEWGIVNVETAPVSV